MIGRLVLAELRHRPGRALFLLGGYALGVAVMVVLLAVGEAMLEQARDQALVGGGDVVLVPAGISTEMLRAGGVTSLFLGVDQARFLQRQVLESERGREEYGVVAASPLLDDRIVELSAGGRTVQAIATGEIPSRARAAGAAPDLLAGAWSDSPADRLWADPSPAQLYDQIDRFHLPTGAAVGDSTWAEWHYFNVVLGPERWLYLLYLVAGEIGTPGRWGGRVLLTVRTAEGEHRALVREVPDERVRFSTERPDLRLGPDNWVAQEDGVYRIQAEVEGRRIDLRIVPEPGRYFPPAELGGEQLPSGYVVPALLAEAEGVVCLPECEPVRAARAYHDHNWGVWRDVTWEWGAASNPRLSLLYGVVRAPELEGQGLFAYLVDQRGALGLFRPDDLEVLAARTRTVNGTPVPVPERLRFEDARRGLRVTVDVQDAHVTESRPGVFFIQMRGVAEVERPGEPAERLQGFFETYVTEN